MRLYIIIGVILAVLAGVVFWFSSQDVSEPSIETSLKPSQGIIPTLSPSMDITIELTGVLTTEGETGEEGRPWHIVFEKPGEPALNYLLQFTPESRCLIEYQEQSCILNDDEIGSRVKIQGIQRENYLLVVLMEKVN